MRENFSHPRREGNNSVDLSNIQNMKAMNTKRNRYRQNSLNARSPVLGESGIHANINSQNVSQRQNKFQASKTYSNFNPGTINQEKFNSKYLNMQMGDSVQQMQRLTNFINKNKIKNEDIENKRNFAVVDHMSKTEGFQSSKYRRSLEPSMRQNNINGNYGKLRTRTPRNLDMGDSSARNQLSLRSSKIRILSANGDQD